MLQPLVHHYLQLLPWFPIQTEMEYYADSIYQHQDNHPAVLHKCLSTSIKFWLISTNSGWPTSLQKNHRSQPRKYSKKGPPTRTVPLQTSPTRTLWANCNGWFTLPGHTLHTQCLTCCCPTCPGPLSIGARQSMCYNTSDTDSFWESCTRDPTRHPPCIPTTLLTVPYKTEVCHWLQQLVKPSGYSWHVAELA